MLKTFSEELTGKVLTPAANDLFFAGAGGLLRDSQREIFHSIVAKGIFVAKRSGPDIGPTIAVLSGQVRAPNNDDWEDLRRLLNYLKRTIDEHVMVRIDGIFQVTKWYVDATFTVHPYFKSHTCENSSYLLISYARTGAQLHVRVHQEVRIRAHLHIYFIFHYILIARSCVQWYTQATVRACTRDQE